MTFDTFIAQYNGKGIDVDNFFGFQCMDLAHRYAIDCVGKDIPAGNAKDMWDHDIDGYDKITNSPDGVPNRGDIVVWGTGVGVNGHIAVFISGDTNAFVSFDQNWPLGSLCHQQNHNYTGVLGWFHPKQVLVETVAVPKDQFEKLVGNSTKYDAFVAGGYNSIDDVNTRVNNLRLDNQHLSEDRDNLGATVTTLTARNAFLEEQVAHIPSSNGSDTTPQHSEFKLFGRIFWLLN